jgi:hypothetical protein
VTFLFTDIEGSTERWERYREAMKGAVARHDAVMRESLELQAGYIFKTAPFLLGYQIPPARHQRHAVLH